MLLGYSQVTLFARENTPLRSVKFVKKVPRQQRRNQYIVVVVYGH